MYTIFVRKDVTMKIIDFTHMINKGMPLYPGTPGVQLEPIAELNEQGYRETDIHITSHTGTHVDAPFHLEDKGVTLDQIDPECFVGSGVVIDCTDCKAGELITMEHIALAEIPVHVEFLLFYTGWSRHWGNQSYFGQFPVLNQDVLNYVLGLNLKGIGVDTASIDPVDDASLVRHHKILQQNMIIYENLRGLEFVKGKSFTFCGLPLFYNNADGAPVRAIGILEETNEIY